MGGDNPAAVQQRRRGPAHALRDLHHGGLDFRDVRGGGLDLGGHAADQGLRSAAGLVLHFVHAGWGVPRAEPLRWRRRRQLQEGALMGRLG